MDETKKSKKITVALVLSWIFGPLFALTGIISIFSEPILGIVMLVMATVLLPPINKLVDDKWNFHLSKGIKAIVIIIGFIIFGATVDTSNTANQENNQSQIQQKQEQPVLNIEQQIEETKSTEEQTKITNNEEPVNGQKTEPILTSNEEEKPVPTNDTAVPAEYKSALAKADSYANNQHMSKKGLYNQLTSEYGEQFSKEATQYAVDNVKTDWKANALAKATSYANNQHMSKKSVYDQLVSEYGEQFTKIEAQYAIDNVESDWNANALAKAKSYQETQNMSPAAIYDQLISEYGEEFTKAEADYAIQHLND